jgi:hypothetical protein
MSVNNMDNEELMGRVSEMDPVPAQDEPLLQDHHQDLSFIDQPLPSPNPPSEHNDG